MLSLKGIILSGIAALTISCSVEQPNYPKQQTIELYDDHNESQRIFMFDTDQDGTVDRFVVEKRDKGGLQIDAYAASRVDKYGYTGRATHVTYFHDDDNQPDSKAFFRWDPKGYVDRIEWVDPKTHKCEAVWNMGYDENFNRTLEGYDRDCDDVDDERFEREFDKDDRKILEKYYRDGKLTGTTSWTYPREYEDGGRGVLTVIKLDPDGKLIKQNHDWDGDGRYDDEWTPEGGWRELK